MKVIEIDQDAFEKSFDLKKGTNKQGNNEVVKPTVVRNSLKTIATYP